MPLRRTLLPILALALALSACARQDTDPAEGVAGDGHETAATEVAEETSGEWLSTGGDDGEQRHSALKSITPANVAALGIAWTYDLGSTRGAEATPIVADGVLYMVAPWSVVHAIDARSGRALWIYDPKVDHAVAANACCGVASRGVAYRDGTVYLATLDGRLEAIDAGTGMRLWTTQTADPGKRYTVTGAPRVVRNLVLIGNSGADLGVRGYVTAYSRRTGKLVWRFYTVPNPNKLPDGAASDDALTKTANPSWGNNGLWKTSGGGGTVDDSIVFDSVDNLVLFGTGRGSPWNALLRDPDDSGDNLFLSSIVAVDADSGQYRWHFQETPRDTWSYSATQSIVLADLPLADKERPQRVVLHAGGNGFFYLLDARTGRFLSGKGFVPQTWARGLDAEGRPVEARGARPRPATTNVVSPGLAGGHGWNPMAFDPGLGLAFIPAQETEQALQPLDAADGKSRPDSGYAPEAGVPTLPLDESRLEALRRKAKGRLIAWDPVKEEARWSVEQPLPGNGGVLSTASGLVFQGTADGQFAAYDARSGKRLWHAELGEGIVAPPVSYEIDGEQYVAVAVGLSGDVALSSGYLFPTPAASNEARLVVFRLGGTGSMPPTEAAAPPRVPAAGFATQAMLDLGRSRYARSCAGCHGSMAISSGALPDLRWSDAAADAAAWRSVVLSGSLLGRGMPGFGKQLSADEAEAVRAYVVAQGQGAGAGPAPAANAKAGKAPTAKKAAPKKAAKKAVAKSAPKSAAGKAAETRR